MTNCRTGGNAGTLCRHFVAMTKIGKPPDYNRSAEGVAETAVFEQNCNRLRACVVFNLSLPHPSFCHYHWQRHEIVWQCAYDRDCTHMRGDCDFDPSIVCSASLCGSASPKTSQSHGKTWHVLTSAGLAIDSRLSIRSLDYGLSCTETHHRSIKAHVLAQRCASARQ